MSLFAKSVYLFRLDENLAGLNYQLTNPKLKHICDILSAVHSTYVRQFLMLAEEIHRNMLEAKSNIEYLQIIKMPCLNLSAVTLPNEIIGKLPHILNLFRYIWMKSTFFNTREKITSLCRALSNQIILQCKDFINFQVVFKDKHSRAAIKMFQTCIDCCIDYIKVYVSVSIVLSNSFRYKIFDTF